MAEMEGHSPDERKWTEKRLEKHWPPPRVCACCQNQGPWRIQGTCIMQHFTKALVPGAPVVPMLMVICESCFAVRFFDAISLGILDAQSGRFLTEVEPV